MEEISNRYKKLAFPESAVQYLRGDISVPPRGFPKPLQSKVLKYRKLYVVEGRPRYGLGEYKFDKAVKKLRSK